MKKLFYLFLFILTILICSNPNILLAAKTVDEEGYVFVEAPEKERIELLAQYNAVRDKYKQLQEAHEAEAAEEFFQKLWQEQYGEAKQTYDELRAADAEMFFEAKFLKTLKEYENKLAELEKKIIEP